LVLFSCKEEKILDFKKQNKEKIIEIVDTTIIERATFYNPTINQCDSNPFITADGSLIDTVKLNKGKLRWVALDQKSIYNKYKARLNPGYFEGFLRFNDTIEVFSKEFPEVNGCWIVKDVMNKRYKNSLDFLLPISGNDFHKFRKHGIINDLVIIY
jgi:hypothetical protein